MKLFVFWPIIFILTICFDYTNSQGLESWSLVDDTLPNKNWRNYVVYESNSNHPDCVWMFGGANYEMDLYCFNITSNSLQYWSQFNVPSSYHLVSNSPSSVIIKDELTNDDYIYFIDSSDYISKYNINQQTLTILNSDLINHDLSRVHMFKNPLNFDQLLLVHQIGLIIYTISTNTIEYGQSLHNSRSSPTVEVINNGYYNEYPYIYVFQGGDTSIERLDLSSNNLINQEWEVLTTRLTTDDSSCDYGNLQDTTKWSQSFLWNDKIYIFGGVITSGTTIGRTWRNTHCILEYNFIDNTVQYFGKFPISISCASLAVAGNKVVVAGGCTKSSMCDQKLNSIYVSNDLGDAYTHPSPTIKPTIKPTDDDDYDNTIIECNSKFIGVNDNTLDWEQSRDYCISYYGSTLATIKSYDDIIEALVEMQDTVGKSVSKFFIGYYYEITSEEWLWLDNSNSDYTYNFIINDNEYCSMIFWKDNGDQQFQTVKCTERYNYFLCNNPDC